MNTPTESSDSVWCDDELERRFKNYHGSENENSLQFIWRTYHGLCDRICQPARKFYETRDLEEKVEKVFQNNMEAINKFDCIEGTYSLPKQYGSSIKYVYWQYKSKEESFDTTSNSNVCSNRDSETFSISHQTIPTKSDQRICIFYLHTNTRSVMEAIDTLHLCNTMKYNLFAVDLPGHGQTKTHNNMMSRTLSLLLIDEGIRVLKQIYGIEQIILYARGMSTAIAMEYCAQNTGMTTPPTTTTYSKMEESTHKDLHMKSTKIETSSLSTTVDTPPPTPPPPTTTTIASDTNINHHCSDYNTSMYSSHEDSIVSTTSVRTTTSTSSSSSSSTKPFAATTTITTTTNNNNNNNNSNNSTYSSSPTSSTSFASYVLSYFYSTSSPKNSPIKSIKKTFNTTNSHNNTHGNTSLHISPVPIYNQHYIKLLILDTPYTSIQDLVNDAVTNLQKNGHYVPLFLFHFAANIIRSAVTNRLGFDPYTIQPIHYVSNIQIPTYIITAKSDDYIPAAHSTVIQKEFSENVPCEVQYVDGTHYSTRPIDIYTSLETFINSYMN